MADLANFGKFRLIKRIGGGRLSQVFSVGRHLGAHVPQIVLKRVDPALIGNDTFVQLVVREAAVLSRLEHAALCSCHEMGVIDGCAFLTLDMVDGCTLRALMRRMAHQQVKLPDSAVVALVLQLAQVLNYLHQQAARPMVHLDLSPQNVMISVSGEVKLIDFGIAQYLDGKDPPPLGGRIAGTVGYMSPEQAQGHTNLAATADQYALGVLFWELLAGRKLFRGNTAATWKAMKTASLPRTNTLTERPPQLVALAMQMLSLSPDERVKGLDEVITRLTQVFSVPLSGMRPLGALVRHLLADIAFDRYDMARRGETSVPVSGDIPSGEAAIDEYEEISIQVDFEKSASANHIRAAVPELESPFIED